jgi:hypothetical protein
LLEAFRAEEDPVKRIDYYAVQGPWKMPKWVGAAIGGVFVVIAVGCAYVIFAMVRPPIATAAVATAPSVTTPATPAAQPAVAAAPAATDETADAPATPDPAKATKHAKASKHHGKVVVAKASKKDKSISDAKAHAILAKHDSKQNRKAKDDLDRLLGL